MQVKIAQKQKPAVDITNSCPTWLVTLGDAMSLMLTFFVLLLTFSDIHSEKLTELVGVLSGTRGMMQADKSTNSPQVDAKAEKLEELSPTLLKFSELPKRLTETRRRLRSQGFANQVLLEELKYGLRVRILEDVLFTPEGGISEDGRAILHEAGNLINGVDNEVRLLPLSSSGDDARGSSYDKSRAVAEVLVAQGAVEPKRFGFGERLSREVDVPALFDIFLMDKVGLKKLRFSELWEQGAPY